MKHKLHEVGMKPEAAALPRTNEEIGKGMYGSAMPKTPANAASVEKAVRENPRVLAPLRLHYLRWVLFDNDTRFMYIGIFDTDFDKYTEDAIILFTSTGINTVFENLEGFPADWKTNPEAFTKFVREHQCPSFLEYGEYPYVTADEIKKALKVKQ